MRYLLVLGLAAVAAAEPSVPVVPQVALVAAPVVAATQYHAQDEIGQYSYGYSNPLSAKSEIKAADGKTVGAYTYVDPDGKIQTVEYASDPAHGFRVAATNLPIAPAVPVVPKLVSPVPVEDTPEVVEARTKHLDALKAAELRAKADAEAILALRSAFPALPAAVAAPAVALSAAPALPVAAVVSTRKSEPVPTPVKADIEVKAASNSTAGPAPAVSSVKTVENLPGGVVKTTVTEVRTTPIVAEPALAVAAPAIQAYSIGVSPILAGPYLAHPFAYSTHLLAVPSVIGESNAVVPDGDSVSVEAAAKTAGKEEEKKE